MDSEYQRKKEKIKQDVDIAIESVSESEQKLRDIKDSADKSYLKVLDQKEKLSKMAVFINTMPASSYTPTTATQEHMDTLSKLMGAYVQDTKSQLSAINNASAHMNGIFASSIIASGTMDASGNVFFSIAEEISPSYAQMSESLGDLIEPTESEKRDQIEKLLRRIDSLLADKFREAFRTFFNGNFMSAAHAMRDVLSDLAHKIAPDDKVINMPWYKKEPETRGPTQRQRFKYGIIGQSTEYEIGEEEIEAIDRLVKEGRNIYSKLSSEAHRREGNWERERVRQYLSIGQNVINEILLLREKFFTETE